MRTTPRVSVMYDSTGGTGSFKYMAPEVFLGRMSNERADIYSWVRPDKSNHARHVTTHTVIPSFLGLKPHPAHVTKSIVRHVSTHTLDLRIFS